MRVLITGVTGFAGGHLAEALLAQGGLELHGISRQGRWPREWSHLDGRLPTSSCDLCDRGAVETLLRDVQPDRIFHLAGYADVGSSTKDPNAAWSGNLQATRTLYETIVQIGAQPRILYVGSGLIYGFPESVDQAFNEDSPLRPVNPYAASKAASDLVGYQYSLSPGIDIVRVRPFNHIGPRQTPNYAVANFARQIAAIERGLIPPVLSTGNLTPLRDMTDVRDMVAAYVMLMEGGRTGDVYNVASGDVHSIQEVIDRLLNLARVPIEIRQKAELIRAFDNPVVRGDAGKIRREIGWAPKFSLDQTLQDTLDYWRSASPDSQA